MTDFQEIKKDVLLFDGVCNLCNGSVQMVLKYDKNHRFLFASLQSGFGQKVLEHFNLPTDNFHSFILLRQGKILHKSTAALEVARKLGGLWPLLYVFIAVPPFIRHAMYDVIARNRYRWFGRREACMIPTEDLKQRFLE